MIKVWWIEQQYSERTTDMQVEDYIMRGRKWRQQYEEYVATLCILVNYSSINYLRVRSTIWGNNMRKSNGRQQYEEKELEATIWRKTTWGNNVRKRKGRQQYEDKQLKATIWGKAWGMRRKDRQQEASQTLPWEELSLNDGQPAVS